MLLLRVGQEILRQGIFTKTLLPMKQPCIKQVKKFGAYEKKSISTNVHSDALSLVFDC